MQNAQNDYFNQPGIGLGCMNLSHAYGKPLSEPEAMAALHAAFDMGYCHFDTATLYGNGTNERLLGKALKEKRERLFLASKCGMAIGRESGVKEIDGRPETLKRQCEESLRRLQTDCIDLYYLHRLDRQVPIEDSVGALADLVSEGKIRALGLSEVSAVTLRRARKVHPIAAVQSEYSLWSRNPEIALLDACRETGTALVAFSPLARGFLTGSLQDIATLEPGDIRTNMPRFDAANFAKNLALLGDYGKIAEDAGCTPSQLALAWIRSKGDFIIPIAGTRNSDHMRENLQAERLILTNAIINRLDALINPATVAGPRYNATQQAEIDTEEFTG